jgi:hypothetical protein
MDGSYVSVINAKELQIERLCGLYLFNVYIKFIYLKSNFNRHYTYKFSSFVTDMNCLQHKNRSIKSVQEKDRWLF